MMMTTKLAGENTHFLPFNRGKGEGIHTGAGNPEMDGELSVAYMWREILTKDSILELISKFIFLERREEEDDNHKLLLKETLIFPRFHQLDLLRKILADVRIHKRERNYLIQHSAGSGKTNSIAWLAHRLVSLHDEEHRVIYDTTIIVTDRVVVDRQLQQAVLGQDHVEGLIRAMGDGCTSQDLKAALEGNTKIVITTIQKFPFIVEGLRDLEEKNFAVIIDEAHSSTSGKNMVAVSQSLSSGSGVYEDEDDMILSEIRKSGKQSNVSYFAFTATPKAMTLKMFGRPNEQGNYEAFHLYSMKQAIEEGFILDVLQKYTTYRSVYRLNKEIEEDPELKTSDAFSQIFKYVDLHDTNIAQRVKIVVEHFRSKVMDGLGGQAKAMVVTSSREAAVKYAQAFDEYVAENGYNDIRALVAFSGKVSLEGEEDYTEYGMNQIREEEVPFAFDSEQYNVMIVANKYQTGFDQKKLSAMYIFKRLSGVNAVQTLSRLNRIYPPHDKKVFVLDFVNDYEDIKNAFARYYTTTILSKDFSPEKILELFQRLEGFYFLDAVDVERFSQYLYGSAGQGPSPREQRSMMGYLKRAQGHFENLSKADQREAMAVMKSFIKFYEFIIQVSSYEDVNVHKYYIFLTYLMGHLSVNEAGPGFDLRDKIRATRFSQKLLEEHEAEKMPSKPMVQMPDFEPRTGPVENRARLSEIIQKINELIGDKFDQEAAANAIIQLKEKMEQSEHLKNSAKNNTPEDFSLTYYREVEGALLDNRESYTKFFDYLLKHPTAQREIMGLFLREIYKNLRASA